MGAGGWGVCWFVEGLWLVLSMTWLPCCASAGGPAWTRGWRGRGVQVKERALRIIPHSAYMTQTSDIIIIPVSY